MAPIENQKTNTINDKVFTDNPFGYLFSDNHASFNFANNNGYTEFTSSSSPDAGSGFEDMGTGSLTYINTSFPIYYGAFENYGDGWFRVILLDVIFNTHQEPQNYNGIAFNLKSPYDGEIYPGEYKPSTNAAPYSLEDCILGLYMNTSSEEIYEPYLQVTVSKTGNMYNFTFLGMVEIGKGVNGFFSGQLTNLDPEPNPSGYMSAKVNGMNWNASMFYAELDDTYDVLIIYGENTYGEIINLNLYSNHKTANYIRNDIIYPSSVPNIIITENTGTNISGTFSFSGYDWETNTGSAIITDGVFYNVPFIEK